MQIAVDMTQKKIIKNRETEHDLIGRKPSMKNVTNFSAIFLTKRQKLLKYPSKKGKLKSAKFLG